MKNSCYLSSFIKRNIKHRWLVLGISGIAFLSTAIAVGTHQKTNEPVIVRQASKTAINSSNQTSAAMDLSDYGTISWRSRKEVSSALAAFFGKNNISDNLQVWYNQIQANNFLFSNLSNLLPKILEFKKNNSAKYSDASFVTIGTLQKPATISDSITIDPFRATIKLKNLLVQLSNPVNPNSSTTKTNKDESVKELTIGFLSTYNSQFIANFSGFIYKNNLYSHRASEAAQIGNKNLTSQELVKYVRMIPEEKASFVGFSGNDFLGKLEFNFLIKNFYVNGIDTGPRTISFSESGFFASLPIILGTILPSIAIMGSVGLYYYRRGLLSYRKLYKSKWKCWRQKGRYSEQHRWLRQLRLKQALGIKKIHLRKH